MGRGWNDGTTLRKLDLRSHRKGEWNYANQILGVTEKTHDAMQLKYKKIVRKNPRRHIWVIATRQQQKLFDFLPRS
ncbi:hypothetical protein H5410_010777 [Solanum commersonii]|uniref:Uncharacterized protein n=1 Tax=Solanum commersonii TaxID=4109 RepID=A0A9J6ANC6_SOLCO|nr:hypothetical protein H5410_010777 [Solanum commersonii]